MPFRSHYWTCSRFADWLRGTAKPVSEAGSGWQRWRQLAESAHPVRYWLAETGLPHVQNVINWIPDRINSVRYYINNRWVTRTHALTAHSRDIPRGEWKDVGNRFLPCLFNELVDFVEIETAGHHVLWDSEARKKYCTPWWRRWYRGWRCPAAGIAHLQWAAGLHQDESWGFNPGDAGYGDPPRQAQDAREILELYTWWTEVYRNRPDPYEASGWSAWCESRRDDGDFLLGFESESAMDQAHSDRMLKKLQELEQAYEQEDEAMMIRLVRVRGALWT